MSWPWITVANFLLKSLICVNEFHSLARKKAPGSINLIIQIFHSKKSLEIARVHFNT